jgi:uncharacterized membrane protein YbhN (UPF0104 family)
MIAFLKRYGATIFGVVLLAGAIYVVQREFRGLSVAQVHDAMAAISRHALWLAAGCTLLAYAVLAIYDRLGSLYAGKPASWARSLMASFCGYSLAHNLGFAAVSGAAVRFRFYSAWGYSAVQIAKVIGIAYPPNALFLAAVFFILLLLLNVSVALSRLQAETRILAQRLAILESDHKQTSENEEDR